MVKLFFAAALAASLLVAVSASAGDSATSLSGKWLIHDDMRAMVVDVQASGSGDSLRLVAQCQGACGCPYETGSFGSRTLLNLAVIESTATLARGTILACATSEKLVKDCGVKASYDVSYDGAFGSGQIGGFYLADGWAYKDSGGKWTACHRDDFFTRDLRFAMEQIGKRPCGPEMQQGFVFLTPSNGKSELYQTTSTSSPVVGHPPAGARLRYTQKASENGQTWYYVNPPAAAPGWVPASDASCTRPHPVNHRPLKPIDPNARIVEGTMAFTAAARG